MWMRLEGRGEFCEAKGGAERGSCGCGVRSEGKCWELRVLRVLKQRDRDRNGVVLTTCVCVVCQARARILQIHSRKMNVSDNVNYEELARCTDDFNGAQLKAVAVEAGMLALRRGGTGPLPIGFIGAGV